MKKLLKLKYVGILVLMGASAQTFAQDLLAEQAPLDKQMNWIDSVVFKRLIEVKVYEHPAEDIYPDWNNNYVFQTNAVMPDSLLIDLTGFSMPIAQKIRINDVFGYRPRRGRMHYGVDIDVDRGDTIYSTFEGKVRYVSFQQRGYGHHIVIRHPNGLETIYAHLDACLVEENQVVKSGEPIGLGGNTGRSSGPHLHFETRLLGQALNPASFFDFSNQDVTGDSFLYVKQKKQEKEPSSAESYYKVRNGDSLGHIAMRKGVSVKQLCKLNGITTQTTLRVGQVLRLY